MIENSFWEAICDLRQRRLIPRQWTRDDLRHHLSGQYSPNTVNTVPSNQSVTRDGSQKGNYVIRGLRAKAWRVGRGKFELIDDPEDVPRAKGMRPELDDPKEARLKNIIDMGLQFSGMIRLFEEGSKRELHREIVAQAREVFRAECEGQFKEIHSSFCNWGVTRIVLAERKKRGQVIKKIGPVSYGQIAKTFDVVLKVAVYYCHLPNYEKSQQISTWLNAAVDTRMMGMLREYYREDIASWPATIEQVDNSTYLSIQEIVCKFIADRHNGNIIPVQFDDIYWRALNRREA